MSHLHLVFWLQDQILAVTCWGAARTAGPDSTLWLDHCKWRQGPKSKVQGCFYVVDQVKGLRDIKFTYHQLRNKTRRLTDENGTALAPHLHIRVLLISAVISQTDLLL